MKKLTKYQLRQISKNLNFIFNLSTKKQISDGKQWYINANNICKDIAQKYQTDVITAAQVIAALSPRNKWTQNIKDSYKIFDAVKNNIPAEKISNYTTINFDKLLRIGCHNIDKSQIEYISNLI